MNKKEIIKNAKELVLYAIIIGLALYLVTVALGTPTPFIGIKSGSMEPTLHVNDFAVIQGVSGKDIKIGDIIVFWNPDLGKGVGIPIVHRVIQIEIIDGKYFFYTKGDANSVPDYGHLYFSGPVPEDYVIGRVIMINGAPLRIPYLGWFYIKLKENVWLQILLWGLLIGLALWPSGSKHKRIFK